MVRITSNASCAIILIMITGGEGFLHSTDGSLIRWFHARGGDKRITKNVIIVFKWIIRDIRMCVYAYIWCCITWRITR